MGKKQKLEKMGDKSSTFIAYSFSPCFSGNMAYLKGKLRSFYWRYLLPGFLTKKHNGFFGRTWFAPQGAGHSTPVLVNFPSLLPSGPQKTRL